jgi:hypothetical protein
MTISSATNRNNYTGNASTATYAYSFRIFANTHLIVTVRNTDDEETTLALTTDYTVTGVGSASGGNIVLVSSGQAWLTGGFLKNNYALSIRRSLPLTQLTDIRNQGDFYPEGHEDQFDKLVMIDQQQQDILDRTMRLPETITSSAFNPTLPSDISDAASADKVLLINPTNNGWVVGPTATQIINAESSAGEAGASADLAEEWASKTDGIVDTTDYSAKAWAIGGTNVTDTASRGPSKNWAVKTDGAVDTSEFSSKAYAVGGTGVSGAAGSSKEWAGKVDGAVDGSTGFSAKAWSIGGTGVTDTASRGAAKEWAVETASNVDGTEFSAKEYAQGTQAGTGGSAKNWAQQTAADVTGASAGDMSAKEWAVGTLGRGVSGEGSSKDWATYTGGTVDGTEFSAKKYATDAASAINSAFYRDTVRYTSASSPVTLTSSDNGKLHVFDSSGGAISVTLPTIAGVTLPFNLGFLCETAGNNITINRASTDTIQGATTKVLSVAGVGFQLVADDSTSPDKWDVMEFGSVADGSVTTLKLANGSITRAKLADGAVADVNIVAKTTTYTATTDDDVITATTGSAWTLTLPALSGITGKRFVLKKTSSDFNAWTIDGDGSETIDGATSTTINTLNETLEIVAGATEWHIIRRHIPNILTSFTPTGLLTTNVTYTGTYSRDGVYLYLNYNLTFSGATDAGVIYVNLPSGLTMDTTNMINDATTNRGFSEGSGCLYDSSAGDYYVLSAQYRDSSSVHIAHVNVTTIRYQGISNTVPMTIATGDVIYFNIRVPISGWKG